MSVQVGWRKRNPYFVQQKSLRWWPVLRY